MCLTVSTSANGGSLVIQPTSMTPSFSPYTQLAAPYWSDPAVANKARWRLAAVVGLTLGTTGVR